MAQEVVDWKFDKIRLANWSDSGFVGVNESNEQPNLDRFNGSKVNMLTGQRSKI